MVYPRLIAAVSDASHPSWRARSLSVYRFRRDLGYAIGALSAGLIADVFGFVWAIDFIAMLMHSPKMTANSRGTNDPVTSH